MDVGFVRHAVKVKRKICTHSFEGNATALPCVSLFKAWKCNFRDEFDIRQQAPIFSISMVSKKSVAFLLVRYLLH